MRAQYGKPVVSISEGKFLSWTKSLAMAPACVVVVTLLAGCAGTPAPSIPPLRPDLPDDLRQSDAQSPDFRKPPPISSEPLKTGDEQTQAMDELEALRDNHESDTRSSIERR